MSKKITMNKARITRILDLNEKEVEKFGVALQRKKGGRFNAYLAEDGKTYITSDKKEAIRKVKELNKLIRKK